MKVKILNLLRKNPLDGMTSDFSIQRAAGGRQPKKTAIIKFYICDIKSVIILNIHQKIKVLKKP